MALTRRTILKMGGGAMVASAITPAALFAKNRLFTGVTYLPQSYKALSFGSNGFVEHLQKNAADVLDVDFFDSGKLLKADEQLPALRSGTIDFMFHTSSYITRSIPILGITGLPNVVESLHSNPGRLAKGSPLFDLINEELIQEDLIMLSMGSNILEPEYIWSTAAAPIQSLADIKGKKVRVVSFEATTVLESFGAGAVRIPSSELYIAMERGTVDAAVANISTIIGRSIQEQVGVVYKLPITAYGIGIFVQKSRWEKLPEVERAAFQRSVDWFDAESAKRANDVIYPEEFWPKVDAAGVNIIDPSADDLSQLASAAESVVEKWKGEVGSDVGSRAIDLALGKS